MSWKVIHAVRGMPPGSVQKAAQLNRSTLTFLALGLVVSTLLPFQARADDISDLRSQARDFQDHAKSLYRLDQEGLEQMWEAYCGEYDPKSLEDTKFAADIGRQLQDKEKESRDALLAGELPRLRDLAKKIRDSGAESKDKDEAKELIESVENEGKTLQALENGVILRGSNHPFVQFAIEYGKDQHKKMCDEFGESGARACDQNFTSLDGRPDLVTVVDGHLVVYEFKPDNSKAISKGHEQVIKYLDAVAAYYENFFENGRKGGFKSEPDSEHGGKAILVALQKSSEAWSEDGMHLQPVPVVQTYRVCDKKFD